MTRSIRDILRVLSLRMATLLVLALGQLASAGFGATNAIIPYGVRIWQTDEGLPQNSVFAIAQTSDGYLWVGTHEGLARFDGVRFTLVDESAAPELKQGWITALFTASDGSLWIACDGVGVMRLKDRVFTRFSETNGLPSNQTRCFAEGKDGSIWIGTEGGLAHYKDGKFKTLTDKDGLPDVSVRGVREDRHGVLRIATRRGLSSLTKDGQLNTISVGQGMVANALKAVCEDRRGDIWVSSNEGVTKIYHPLPPPAPSPDKTDAVRGEDGKGERVIPEGANGRSFYSVNEGLPDKIATAIYEDRAGRIWVGTYSGVACIVSDPLPPPPPSPDKTDRGRGEDGRGERVTVDKVSPSPPSTPLTQRALREGGGLEGGEGRTEFDGKVVSKPMGESGFGEVIYTIFEDREANLWIGGRDGLYRLRPARFTTFTTQDGLTGNNAMSVCEDQSGAICIGIWGGGLNRLKGKQVTALTSMSGLTHDVVLSLHETRDGSLWVGMDFEGGLNRLHAGGRDVYTRQEGLAGPVVRVIHEDNEGALWIGTSRGLSILRQGKFWSYTTADGLAGNNVMAIRQDSEGRMWIGTDGGLSRWDKEKFVNFTSLEGLSQNFVHAICQATDGTLWIGTKGGLNRFKDGKFTPYTSAHGLFSDEIYEIIEDDFGHFWMSCRKGIFRVRKTDLDALDRGDIKSVTSTVFGKADGLATVQCNGVAKPAAWKARDGRIWFPTIRGVVAVESRIETNDKPPPVLIEEVVANRQILRRNGLSGDTSHTLTVPPGRGELEIHYTALSFQAPEKCHFKYRLEGVDSAWIHAGPDRVARYNNVAPGNHRFHVIACNNDGVWNDAGASLAFVFQPHYWETWWFKLGILAAAGLLLTAFYQGRVRRLRAIENLRIQIAADLHDDVGARLTKVAMVTESVDRETPVTDRSKPHIQNISKTTREVIQAMDEIVWTINPKNDSLDNLANYIFQFAQDYFQNSGVRCRLDVPARLPDHPLSTQQRHNLFMAVKEALNNVLKHARATEVRIGLALKDSKLIITIADDGCGFRADQPHPSGDGLANMKQRLERIGGRLVLDSQPGTGTRITMELEAA